MEQTASDQLREPTIAAPIRVIRQLTPGRQRQLLFAAGGVLVGLFVLFLIVANRYTAHYQGRVYPGIVVAGVPVGGLSQEEAAARLDTQVAAWASQPLTVQTADGTHQWSVVPATLAMTFDTSSAAAAAAAYGHSGNPLSNFFHWLGAMRPFGGHSIALATGVDEGLWEATLRDWAPEVTYFPTNAVFAIEQNGKLTIVADQHGLGIDPEASRVTLVAGGSHLTTKPVALTLVSVAADIDRATLQQVDTQAQAIVSQPLVGQYGGRTWTFAPDKLAGALGYRLVDGHLVAALDPVKMRPYFDEVKGVVNLSGTSAKLVFTNSGKYTITPSQNGFGLDEAATLALMNTTLQQGGHEVALVVRSQAPPIVEADLAPVQARLNQIVGTQLRVAYEEYFHTFYPADIQPLLNLVIQPDQPEKVQITVNQTGLRALTMIVAKDMNQGVRNAQFRFVDRAVRDVVKSQDGREVQFAGTDNAIRAAILGATGAATPVLTVTKPKISSSEKATMATPDRLAAGKTAYTGVSERIHNVELAAERLNGTLIPPGKLFSFNEAVGEQTVANGYQEAYGIALVPGTGGKAGEVKTVSSVAGGICQVSTTLLQAVFRAGLPIQERNTHLFWVGYAASSTGFMGLDATVDDQSGLDFQFYNTTGGWMGIEAVADGEVIYISLYGKNPGWRVDIDDPVITNVQTPDPKPVYEKTHDLVPGTKFMLEHATEGFDAAIRRRVYDQAGKLVVFNGPNGAITMDTTFRSSYTASRDRYQIGVPDDEPLTGPVNIPGVDDDGGQ